MRALLLILAILEGAPVGAAAGVAVHARDGRLVAQIPVRGDGDQCASVEVLDLPDAAQWRAATRQAVHGEGTLVVPFGPELSRIPPVRQSEMTWFRLRYSAGPCGGESRAVTISMSRVLRGAFELRARGSEIGTGKTYRLWVQAVGAAGEPAEGVDVEARLDEGRATGRTGPDGTTVLEIPLSEREFDQSDLKVVGRRQGFAREVELPVYTGWEPRVLISTDKALYQPGQTLHVRAVLFDTSRRPLGEREATVRVEAPDRTVVLHRDVRTSRFGTASMDWVIPDDAATGTYRIAVGPKGSGNGDPWLRTEVDVSRYELPTFTVTVRPEKPWALPGEKATVAVTATYLSGEPLKRFSARIVKSRSYWAARDDGGEPDVVAEGEAGSDGVVRATLELPPFAKSRWRPYDDTAFAAYVTDPSTGRTERRKFELRSSVDPVHVYLLGRVERHPGLPSTIYVSTFYADGTPASCRVEVSVGGRPVGVTRTNRFGIGRLVATLPEGTDLRLVADDGRGRRGKVEEEPWSWAQKEAGPAVRLTVARTIHRRGEPIDLEVQASFQEGTALVDVARDMALLRCESVRIRHGKGRLRIPFHEEFRGPVVIAAYTPDAAEPRNLVDAASYRTVLYPDDRVLDLRARLSKGTYRPGENATARLTLRKQDGTPAAGEIGLTVVDRAVEERAADQERGWWRRSGDPFTEPFRMLLDGDDELAGFRLPDFQRLYRRGQVPPDVELVAEAFLNRWPGYTPLLGTSATRPSFEAQVARTLVSFDTAVQSGGKRLPRTLDEIAARLAAAGVEPPRDPWDQPYRFELDGDGRYDLLTARSAGPDLRFDTPDDVRAPALRVPTLVEEEREIGLAVDRFHRRTGGYPGDAPALTEELLGAGADPASWRDRVGRPVTLAVRREQDVLLVELVSEDGGKLATVKTGFTLETLTRIREAAEEYARRWACPPENRAELERALFEADLDSVLRDPFGMPWFVRFRVEPGPAAVSVFEEGGRRFARRGVQDEVVITVRATGSDGVEGTQDDFPVGQLRLLRPRLEVVVPIDNPEPTKVELPAPAVPVSVPAPEPATFATGPAGGGIRGTVTDENGATLPGVTVTCWDVETAERRTTVSDARGAYVLRGLEAGTYSVEFTLSGFVTLRRAEVVVRTGAPEQVVDAVLRIAMVAEAITVTGEAPVVQTRSVSALANVARSRGAPSRTPRTREFFPETLLFSPSVLTGADGRARVDFRLADNITTWSVFAVATTRDGGVGFTRKDFAAFQPFFVDLEPPPILTVGDEIGLPVVVRNYQPRDQRVEVEMAGGGWMRLLDGPKREATVPANDSRTETFRFRARSAGVAGRLRVTARGLGEPRASQPADAIEKPVTVHPNAEERSAASGAVLRAGAVISCELPSEALEGSATARLTIYPNVLSQVASGIESIVQSPHGCAEQTISLASASVLLLRSLKEAGASRPDLEARTKGWVRAGVEKVSAFVTASGGVSYFAQAPPDLALTAYAVGFLLDAGAFVAVDDALVRTMTDWMVKTQRSDGGWGGQEAGPFRLPAVALAAHALGRLRARSPLALPAARSALAYLAPFVKDPTALGEAQAYVLAALALAETEVGEPARAEPALERLRTLARPSRAGTFWPGGSASPFHGWGSAGDVEVTALAAQALLKSGRHPTLADSAVLYLLRMRDPRGIWFSGHSTVRALEALLLGLGGGKAGAAGGEIGLRVNGETLPPVRMPEGSGALDPLTVDLTGRIRPGANEVALSMPGGGTAAGLLALRYGVPWTTREASGDLAFDVSYDRREARVGQELTVTVHAKRLSARGDGMLLAEVGVPPGAEVDRAVLTDLVRDSGKGVFDYEVRPDRVVFYVWPGWASRDADIRFSFRFRPRYPIQALSAPSTLTDYYNPDARVAVPPARFVIR